MGRPCGAKNFKNRISDFSEKRIFKNVVPSPTDHRRNSRNVYMDAQLHFFRYTKA